MNGAGAMAQCEPLCFTCAGESLIGMLHRPAGDGAADIGVVIVVGGPQYRAGSHRQFLMLARGLADTGIPCLRFDYRGQGDSSGDYLGFEHIGPDIETAIDQMMDRCPDLGGVVLWGLCDAASAIAAYAATDARVRGIAIANPWVRTEVGLARARLRHYYLARLMEPRFWRKILKGEWQAGRSIASLFDNMRGAAGAGTGAREPQDDHGHTVQTAAAPPGQLMPAGPPPGAAPLPDRMAMGLARFDRPILLILSGQDIVAQEFEDAAKARPWRAALGRPAVTRRALPSSDHTFASADWTDQVTLWTRDWIRGLAPAKR